MTHPGDDAIDPKVANAEDLANTDVEGQLDKDPETQRNREDAPEPEDLPDADAD